jgi:hypothetical protein
VDRYFIGWDSVTQADGRWTQNRLRAQLRRGGRRLSKGRIDPL